MNIYFADRSFNILGVASTIIGAKWPIINDIYKEDIDSGMSTLEFDIFYKRSYDRVAAKYIAKEGNYLLYNGIQGQSFFTIIEIESNPIEKTLHIYAEDAGLDLLNEIAPSFSPPNEAKPITYYTDRFLSDDYQIGINEIGSRTRTLSWDSETTLTERLKSLASGFDAEFKFRFEIKGLMVRRKFLDIYARRGKDVQQQLRLGKEIENIIEKRSVANIATALWCTGGTPEVDGETGDPITLHGYSYDDGDFYVDDYTVKSRTALANWGRYNASKGLNSDHTIKEFSYDTLSQVTLCNMAIARLKKLREPEVTYDVSLHYLPKNLNLGDTVNLVDDKGELYLSARLLTLEVSETNDYRTATFGDYIVKTSGLSDRLTQIAAQIREEAAKAVKYEWIVYADDSEGHGISPIPDGKQWIGIAANKITPEPDFDHPLLYKWSKIQGEDGSDGAPGTTIIRHEVFYKLSRSSNHPDTVRKVSENGKMMITEDETLVDDLVDANSNEIIDSNGNVISAYVHNISRIIEGNFSWSTEIPEAIPGYFLWTKVVTEYSNGEEYVSYSIAASGRGVASTKTEYYQSDSPVEPTGGEWGEEIQEYNEDKTYFSRIETTYTDGTSSVTEAKPDKHLNVSTEALAIAERTDKHFFVNTDGVHVTVGENTPNHGKNVLITNEGMAIRNDTTNLASFSASKIQMGEDNTARVEITPQNTKFYNDESTEVATINNQAGYEYVFKLGPGDAFSSDHRLYEAGDGFTKTFTFTDPDFQPTGSFTYFARVDVGPIVRYDGNTVIGNGSIYYLFASNNTTVRDSNAYGSAKLNIVLTDANTSTYTATVTWTSVAGVEFYSNIISISVRYNVLVPTSSYSFSPRNENSDAMGSGSFAAGNAEASGKGAIALGQNAYASGDGAIAIGSLIRASRANQIVLGRNDKSFSDEGSDTAIFKIGNGDGWGTGNNAFYIRSDGTPVFYNGIAGLNAATPTQIRGRYDELHYRSNDLDDYTTPGNYFCTAGAVAETLDHQPFTDSAFQLLVFKFGTMRFQVAWQNKQNSYIRYRIYTSNKAWSNWYSLARGAGDLSSYLTTSSAASTYARKDAVGTVVYKIAGSSGQTKTIKAGTAYTNLTSITCSAGHWAVTAHAAFQPGTVSNYRNVAIGTTAANNTYGSLQVGAGRGSTVIQTTRYIQLSASTNLYLNVYSQEDTTVNLNGCIIEAIRIGG